MAAQIPAALKTADVQRFATRAAQLENFKPIVSYWLEYYVLQQILTKALHNDSSEVATYAAQLMDKVESTKGQFSDEPAVNDDVAAQAYMEQFAAETLARADKAQHEDTVTRQTVDTLQAAATFYDSTAIWGELDTETKAKIKYAKYHALRIARALKDGQDPNQTNPKPQPAEAIPDPDEAEIQDELRQLEQAGISRPTVEDAADIDLPHPSTSIVAGPVSPVAPAPEDVDQPGYFPSTQPPAVTDIKTVNLPESHPVIPSVPSVPPASTPRAQGEVPTVVNHQPQHNTRAQAAAAQPRIPPRVTPAPEVSRNAQTGFNVDDDAVMAAQKHAKWAISALNFEDVPTAVRELKAALLSLGVT